MTVTLVAAVAANGVIGRDGGMPWHLPGDLRHFKRLTMGHVLVMGRRTYEAIGALPGRTTVVVTRQADWSVPEVLTASSLDDALLRAQGVDDDVYVVGGEEIFRVALPVADRMVLTHVDGCPEGDTFFPDVDWAQWREVHRQPEEGYAIVEYEHA